MTKSWPFPIHAVVFDCDGVLLDTLLLYRIAASEIIGQPYSEAFQQTINGLSDRKVAERVVSAFNLAITADEYYDRRDARMRELLPQCQTVDGIVEIVERLKTMRIPMAVATSASRATHEMKTANHKALFSSFSTVICGDEVKEAKPSPEIFQRAAAGIGRFSPENVLVFEDAVNGVMAANAAGMASVYIANPRVDWQGQLEQRGAKPSLTVFDFRDFDFGAFDWQPLVE
jgi:pseudouridine-5'-monophosphatase